MGQKTYRIGEAAAKLNLKSYVLRFWETEFPQIAPIRTEKGQRLYTESDLAALSRIRYLLHERGLTIDGARRLLAEEAAKGTLYAQRDGLADVPRTMPGEAFPDTDRDLDVTPSPDRREAGGGPVQGSLFPLPAHKELLEERESIIMELAAIHRLLIVASSGDAP